MSAATRDPARAGFLNVLDLDFHQVCASLVVCSQEVGSKWEKQVPLDFQHFRNL